MRLHLLLLVLACVVLAAPSASAMVLITRIEFDAGDGDLKLSCVVNPSDLTSPPCIICVGPGETQNFPVESQGSGTAIGVPGQPGVYEEHDLITWRAEC